MHCPAGNATDPISRVLTSSDEISPWTPLKPQHSIPCWLSFLWEPSACKSRQCCQKRHHRRLVGGFSLSGFLGSGRASMLPLGTMFLGLWVIAVDPAFIAGHQSIKNCRVWIDQLDYLPAAMTASFFLIFSEYTWDRLRTNLLHLQFFANNCVYSSHTDIKLVTYCLYRHTTVLIKEILFLAGIQTSLLLTISHHPSQSPCLPWISYATQKMMLDSCKMVEKQSKAFDTFLWHFFPSLKHNFFAYSSSKVSSHPDCIFEIHQLWQSGFSRVYSKCCRSRSFEPEIIKIDKSSHKMYSNKILNFKSLREF